MASSSARLAGIPASPGIAVGTVVCHRTPPAPDPGSLQSAGPILEGERWEAAVAGARAEIRLLREQMAARLSAAKVEIFDVHLSFLDDPEFGDTIAGLIGGGAAAGTALEQTSGLFERALEESGDAALAARAADLRDVVARLHRFLDPRRKVAAVEYTGEVIVVAEELNPSDIAQLDLEHVRGFVTEFGSVTAHAAILARALRVPAVFGLPASGFSDGMTAILDGGTGEVILAPAPAEVEGARRRQEADRAKQVAFGAFARLPGRTADGRAIAVAANIGHSSEISEALAQGAEGIGLLRSEVAYLDRPELPGEEELYRLYRVAVEAMMPHPVIVRTLDIGGDKPVAGLPTPVEANPFLGVRGLRLCLAREETFRLQLRALLRASAHGNLRIMFPMVTLLEEVRVARRWLDEERRHLVAGGTRVAEQVPVGIMIEVPAAALMADRFAAEVDFFSLGTNDLVQYVMAADRLSGQLAHLQAAHHPAVLRLLAHAVAAARRHGKWIGVCGEMAADPIALPLLDGLEVDELSVSPGGITAVRAALSKLRHDDNVRLVSDCLGLGTAAEVADAVRARMTAP
jgi:phosphoenolpyruvate-protein phosphotransferase (PTS system enzyme I)